MFPWGVAGFCVAVMGGVFGYIAHAIASGQKAKDREWIAKRDSDDAKEQEKAFERVQKVDAENPNNISYTVARMNDGTF